MTKLTREQRDHRDRTSAILAINMANDDGKTAAIAVDDRTKMEKMLKRVKRIMKSKRLQYEVTDHMTWIEVKIGDGAVRIFAADILANEMSPTGGER